MPKGQKRDLSDPNIPEEEKQEIIAIRAKLNNNRKRKKRSDNTSDLIKIKAVICRLYQGDIDKMPVMRINVDSAPLQFTAQVVEHFTNSILTDLRITQEELDAIENNSEKEFYAKMYTEESEEEEESKESEEVEE